MSGEKQVVRLHVADTGEMMQWGWAGVEDGEPWETDALRLALNLVPHLQDAIDRAHMKGRTCTVRVEGHPQ